MLGRLIAALAALTLLLVFAPMASADTTLTAVADGYTKSDSTSEVNATTTPLRVDGSPTWNSYVKFEVPAGLVESATLRLTAASTTGTDTDIKTAGSSWDESTLNYSNAPTPGTTLDTIPSITSGNYYDADVTSAVPGGTSGTTTVSFAITTASGTARTFNSREATTGKPELIVVYKPNNGSTNDTIHTISNMEEDAISGSTSTKARFEGQHAGTGSDPYSFDMQVKQVSGNGDGMNLVFRELDDINFYQFDIEDNEVHIRQKIGGKGTATRSSGSNSLTNVTTSEGAFVVGETITGSGIPASTTITAISGTHLGTQTLTLSANATSSGTSAVNALNMHTRDSGCSGYGSLNTSYNIKLVLSDNYIAAYEGGSGTACADWTDTASVSPLWETENGYSIGGSGITGRGTLPSGTNASYYCMPGNYCNWERVDAGPASLNRQPIAWLLSGTDPGYLHTQTIESSPAQSINESRPVYTLGNYKFGTGCSWGSNYGTSDELDHIEHSSDGNFEIHLDEWSAHGTKTVYRARTGQYGYHVDFTSTATRLRRKNPDNTYTTIVELTDNDTPQDGNDIVAANTHVQIKVDGNRHRLIDEALDPDLTLWDVWDSATATGNTTNGSNSVTGVDTSVGKFYVGQTVTGTGIPAGTKVTAISGSDPNETLTLSANATATGTGVALSSVGYTGGTSDPNRGTGAVSNGSSNKVYWGNTVNCMDELRGSFRPLP